MHSAFISVITQDCLKSRSGSQITCIKPKKEEMVDEETAEGFGRQSVFNDDDDDDDEWMARLKFGLPLVGDATERVTISGGLALLRAHWM